MDVVREELLDEKDYFLRGKADEVREAEKRIKLRLLPCNRHNAWRLISYFELFMW